MALPSWLRQQDDAQREQFPANDSYYGERRELGAYGGSPQGAEAQTAQFTVPSNFNRMGPDAGLVNVPSGAGPSQFAQDWKRKVEADNSQQPRASWGTAAPMQPAQPQAAPSQFAQGMAQRFGADIAKSGGWGAPAATAQPMQQSSYAAAQPVAQNRVNPMIENPRTALMNNPAPAQAVASPAQPYEEAGRGWPNRPAERDIQRPEQRGWPDRPAERDMQRPEQRGWPNRPDQRQMPRQQQRGWPNRPAERQPAWGRSQQQPASQGNTASPAQPAQRDTAAYGQPKRWGA